MGVAPKGKLEAVFGEVLRAHRLGRGLSQEEFAFEADIDRTFVSMLERGQRLPSLATLLAVAKPLGLTGAELVAFVERGMAARSKARLKDPDSP